MSARRWRAWVSDAVGPHAVVTSSRRLHGGITSVVHAVDVVDGAGERHRLVLRTYPEGGEGGLVQAEVGALDRLAAAGIEAVPRCIAADASGRAAGRPAVLSSRLPGRPVVAAVDPLRWAEQLAEATVAHLARLGALPSTGLGPNPVWRPLGEDHGLRPPTWVGDPAGWRAAMAPVADALPASASPVQAIHRDFNPGNLLWSRGRWTGTVDWVHLCWGPIEEDLARCRVNIWLLAGEPAAARYLRGVREAGLPYEETWDLSVLADMAHHLDSFAPAATRLGASLTTTQVRARAEQVARQ